MKQPKPLKGEVLVVVISDTHIGSTLGLCPPIVPLDDQGEYHASEAQKLVYDHWTSFWKRQFSQQLPIVVINNADTIDGYHHDTSQVWGVDPQKHIDAAVDLLMPIRQKADRFYSTRGTAAHVGAAGSADEKVAHEIGSIPDNGTFSFYHLKLDVSGVLFDVAHHGPVSGKRTWTHGDALRSYTKSIILDRLGRGEQPPDVVVRSHVHRKRHETVREYGVTCEAIITPAWQLKNEYAYRVTTEDDLSDIGGTVIKVCDGQVLSVDFDVMELRQARSLTA